MAGKPQDRPMVHRERSRTTLPDEPNYSEEMTLSRSGGSVKIVIPSAAVKFLGYEVGQTHEIEVFDSGLWIPREAVDE